MTAALVEREKPGTVIASVGSRPRRKLSTELKEMPGEPHVTGGCNRLGNAMKAVREAYEVAMKV